MKHDIYILQIETATPVCSVAISKNGLLLARLAGAEPNVHASHLTLLIAQLLEEQSLSYNQLSAIAVSMGPGSYTGLRIGVSTAKGLCYALDIPLIGVNSLAAMYSGYRASAKAIQADFYLPMIDARRMEVYTAIYQADHRLLEATSAKIIDADSFESLLSAGQQVVLFGSGADKFAPMFAALDALHVVEGFESSAADLSELAYAQYSEGSFADLAYFEPFYLKDFVASTPKKRN